MEEPKEVSRISEDRAALVLDRAAKIDARHGRWLDVAELREAALEAGISLEAFERALVEVDEMIARGSQLEAAAAASAAAPDPAGGPGKLARRSTMLAAGFLLGGLGLLLSGPFGFDAPGIVFALVLALATVIAAVVRHSRRRDVLEFEIDFGLLWVGLTFLLMLSGEPDRVLATMGVLGSMAALTGGALVALTGAGHTPKGLPDRT